MEREGCKERKRGCNLALNAFDWKENRWINTECMQTLLVTPSTLGPGLNHPPTVPGLVNNPSSYIQVTEYPPLIQPQTLTTAPSLIQV